MLVPGVERDFASSEAAAIRSSALFDVVWYLERNPAAAAFPDAIEHYISAGARQGRAPHPLFDDAWYRQSNPGLEASGLTPLGHFVLVGEAAGASPSPLFDPVWYASQDPGLRGKRQGLFRHFLEDGAVKGRSPHPAFDPAFYFSARPDVAAAKMNPLTHFLGAGAGQGVSPNPFFDLPWYAGCHADVAESGLNPLVHFLQIGAEQNRRPHPNVDLVAYRARTPACPRHAVGAYLHLLAHENPVAFFATSQGTDLSVFHAHLAKLGLFDAKAYVTVNEDLAKLAIKPAEHFASHGLQDGRVFTSVNALAGVISKLQPTLATAQATYLTRAEQADALGHADPTLQWFRQRKPSIGVFCNTEGNFYMQEIADLLADGLRHVGIPTARRDQTAAREEPFDLRIFVAPHEFFYLGRGMAWQDAAGDANTVLYNVEQMQTQWFCRAFKLLLMAPLVIDINFQSAEILRQLGCQSAHFLPGHLPAAPFTMPVEDVSDITLAQGYGWARRPFNWMQQDALDDRPIDILFIGASSPRRDKALNALLELTDQYRFLCVYKPTGTPLTAKNQLASSGRINCALAQRSKIVLNIYRDWLGYFDWSRIVQMGFWQGACVVSDPGLAHPIYQPGVHFQEEPVRHLGELTRWLLETPDGRATLDSTRRAGTARARALGAMPVALAPVLDRLRTLLPA